MDRRIGHCADVVVAALLIAAGFSVGGPVIAATVGAAGVNWASTLSQNGWSCFRRRLWADSGDLNHNLQSLVGHAFEQAWVDLEAGWWGTHAGGHMKRTDRGAEERIGTIFRNLREDARAALASPGAGQLTEAQVIELAGREEETARRVLATTVAGYFAEAARSEERREELVGYVTGNLADRLSFRFGEELKKDAPENNKACRAFQRLMAEGIQESVRTVEAGVLTVQAGQGEVKRDIAALRAELTAWTEEMDRNERSSPDRRETRYQEALERVVAGLEQRILAAMARGFEETRWVVIRQGEQTEERLAGVVREEVGGLRGDLQQMRELYSRSQQMSQEGEVLLREGLARELARQAVADQRRREQEREWRVGDLSGVVTDRFRDRVDELRGLRAHLADERLRFLLVPGLHGVGKTSLVAKLVKELRGDRTLRAGSATIDVMSVVWLPCRSDNPPSVDRIVGLFERTLEPEAAAQLATKWKDGSPLSERLEFLFHRVLGRWPCLLVLDNFEDLLDEGSYIREELADLRALIEKCLKLDHGMRIVATSARSLMLPAELYARVGERYQEMRRFDGLPEDEAVALLRDLDHDGGLGIKGAPDGEVREVVVKFQRVPRAIESVRSELRRLRTWARLYADKAALERLAADPAKARYETLTSEELLVVQALAVYGRPAPAAAVRSLLPGLDVEASLGDLERDLIVAYDRDTFQLHPSDQEYAYAQIPEAEGEYTRAALHTAAAGYFRGLRRPESEWRTIEDLEPQLREFHHLVRAELYDEACSLLDVIDFDYLSLWGHSPLVIELRSQLVGCLTRADLEMDNCTYLGLALQHVGEAWQSVRYLERALELAREATDTGNIGWVLGNLGNAHIYLGETRRAIALYQQALEIAREVGDRRGEGNHLGNLGIAHARLGDTRAAIRFYEQALEIARETGDRQMEGSALGSLGWVAADMEDFELSVRRYAAALAIANDIGDRAGSSHCLEGLGYAHHHLGNMDDARRCYEDALALDVPTTSHSCATMLGILHLGLGDEASARGYLNRSIGLCRSLLDKTPDLYGALYTLALARLARGEADGALATYQRALEACSASGVVKRGLQELRLLERASPPVPGLAEARALLTEALG